MALKLKFRDGTPLSEAKRVVQLLEDEGFPTTPAFASAKRPSLALLFRIDVGEARLADVKRVLKSVRARFEFVEGPAVRRPAGGAKTAKTPVGVLP